MAVAEHNVSYRNGSQIMVAGLDPPLWGIGYRRGANVQVSDPAGNPANPPWVFVVPNDEDATLACRNPAPPAWIQPGIRIRIEVNSPADGSVAVGSPKVQPAVPVPTSPQPGPIVPPPHESVGGLQTVKLVLEIAAIAVTVIGGIIALVWRFKQ